MSRAPAAADQQWMERALELAQQSLGRATPAAAAVLSTPSALLGEWHGTEAELAPWLRSLGRELPEATLHLGIEPELTSTVAAILEAGVGRVAVALSAPRTPGPGAGISALRHAGVPVDVGTCAAEARHLHAAHIVSQRAGRPFIALKAATTLDGRVADAQGFSKWITGPAARNAGHVLRNTHDAILIGSGTLLADDPSLSCRIPGGRNPVPVVLDSRLRCPSDARVLSAGARPLVFCAEGVNLRPLPAEVLAVARSAEGLDLNAVMTTLLDRGLKSVLVEGGPRVHHALVRAGMVDRIHLFVNARLLAGGTPWVVGPPFSLADAPGYRFHSSAPVGDDLHVVLTPLDGPLAPAPE